MNYNVTVNGKVYSVTVEKTGAAPVAAAPVAAAPVAAAPVAAPVAEPVAAPAEDDKTAESTTASTKNLRSQTPEIFFCIVRTGVPGADILFV